MTDERLGLPSISSLGRLALCPGSRTLGKFVTALYPPKDDKVNAAALSGTKIHSALAGEEAELTGFEEWTRERCEKYETDLLEYLKTEYSFIPKDAIRERRLPLYGHNGEIIATGASDVEYDSDTAICVIDYKSGSVGAGAAELNFQLTGYAVISYENFEKQYGRHVDKVFIALIQPNAPEKMSVVELSFTDVRRAGVEIRKIIEKAESGTAERHADLEVQCKFCPAKAFCPEWKQAADGVLVKFPDLETAVKYGAKNTVEDIIQTAPIEDIIKLYEKRAVLESINKAVASRIKRQLAENPQSVEGYYLAPSGSVRNMPDLDEAWEIASKIMDRKEFTDLLSISIPSLEQLHKEKLGLKGKEAEEDFELAFGHLIVKVPKEPMIKKIK